MSYACAARLGGNPFVLAQSRMTTHLRFTAPWDRGIHIHSVTFLLRNYACAERLEAWENYGIPAKKYRPAKVLTSHFKLDRVAIFNYLP